MTSEGRAPASGARAVACAMAPISRLELAHVGRLGHVVIEAGRRGAPPILPAGVAAQRDQRGLAHRPVASARNAVATA